jgi:hypothetical protein
MWELQLNKAYLDFCKSRLMPALAGSDFSSMCRVLADQVWFLIHYDIILLFLNVEHVQRLFQTKNMATKHCDRFYRAFRHASDCFVNPVLKQEQLRNTILGSVTSR